MKKWQELLERVENHGFDIQLMTTKPEEIDHKKLEDIGYELPDIVQDLKFEFETLENGTT